MAAADTPLAVRSLRAQPAQSVGVVDLGLLAYREAWALQHALVDARQRDDIDDTVVLVEHPPVYTLGRRADSSNVLLDPDALEAAGIDLVAVDRGGDVTYHGPGQLVVYPIVRLAGSRHVVDFVRALEEVALRTLALLGVIGERREGLTGVWVGREKIVAIGVRVGALGVTSHGLALNVDPDLHHFTGIIPCGITTEGVCSLASLGMGTDMPTARTAMRNALADVLGTTLVDVDLERLLPHGMTALPSEAGPTDENDAGAARRDRSHS
jgi:lipoyl(octanoyl) transferase